MNYEFIKRTEDDGSVTFCALPTGSFTEINVSDTYDSNGQSVGADDAGNWIELKSKKSFAFAKKSAKENDLTEKWKKYGLGHSAEIVNAYDFWDIYSDILNSDLVEGKDYTHECPGCKAFTFWDGHNWKSLVVSYDVHDWNCDVELVDDEEFIAELNQAIDECEWESESGGYVKYSHPAYNIEKSNWQGNPYSYELSAKDEE